MQVITHLGLGGAERVAFSLVRGLKEDFSFGVFTPAGLERSAVGRSMRDELRDSNVPWFDGTGLPIKLGGMVLAGLQLLRACRLFKPDVIHLHTEIPEASYAAARVMGPSVGRIPLARTIHNSIYWQPWRRLGRWCEQRMGGHIACVSQSARDAFDELRRESTDKPLPADPVVIHNGVEIPPHQQNGSPASLSDPSHDPAEIRVLFAGRFEEQKGADLLPRVVRQVSPPEGRHVKLTVFGHGTYEGPLKALADEPPAGWHVDVHPPVSDLIHRLGDFDLMLMPSRYEGLSLLAMESQLSGLPVVATRAPGLREGFATDYPWLAEPGDAAAYAELLHRVLAAPATWGEVSRGARTFAEQHFTATAMCRQYRDFYAGILAKSA